MTDVDGDKVTHYINPGEFFFGDETCEISTLLGSCIAITLWHPKLRIGGMCHFLLPSQVGLVNVSNTGEPAPKGKYADQAMILFEEQIRIRRLKITEFQAKVFGGGAMVINAPHKDEMDIGAKNYEKALKLLEERNIALVSSHVGQTGHRRIIFCVETGDVWVKHEPLNVPSDN